MQWKIDSSHPVYQQIKEHIRNAVITGEYSPGCRIPSVRELAVEAHVNPNTMQRALMELEQEMLLISNGTLGRFVTEDQTVITKVREDAIREAVQISAAHFKELGLSLQEAGKLLAQEEV